MRAPKARANKNTHNVIVDLILYIHIVIYKWKGVYLQEKKTQSAKNKCVIHRKEFVEKNALISKLRFFSPAVYVS